MFNTSVSRFYKAAPPLLDTRFDFGFYDITQKEKTL
jgi:hypothetical protein